MLETSISPVADGWSWWGGLRSRIESDVPKEERQRWCACRDCRKARGEARLASDLGLSLAAAERAVTRETAAYDKLLREGDPQVLRFAERASHERGGLADGSVVAIA